jgi:hypothetical protein
MQIIWTAVLGTYIFAVIPKRPNLRLRIPTGVSKKSSGISKIFTFRYLLNLLIIFNVHTIFNLKEKYQNTLYDCHV